MGLEARFRLQVRKAHARLDRPDVHRALSIHPQSVHGRRARIFGRTVWLPATSAEPSDATETDRIGTSSSGSCGGESVRGGNMKFNERTDQLVAAAVAPEIPDLDRAALVARDELALVRVQRDVVHGREVRVVPLR